jgi:hypothetical protein
VSPPHRESQPGQTSEVAAGEPVFGGYDEEGQAFDWLVDQQPGNRHDGQGHGTEESRLSADSCKEHQDDEPLCRSRMIHPDHQGRGVRDAPLAKLAPAKPE